MRGSNLWNAAPNTYDGSTPRTLSNGDASGMLMPIVQLCIRLDTGSYCIDFPVQRSIICYGPDLKESEEGLALAQGRETSETDLY